MAAILSRPQCVDYMYNDKPFGAEVRTLQENYVNTMGVDALAPCVHRSSATMVFTIKDNRARFLSSFLKPAQTLS